MLLTEALRHASEEIREGVHATVADLDEADLVWRPHATANSIGWLVWHLARVQDAQVAHIAEAPQVWSPEWAGRFGLPPDFDDTGYGHSPDDVARIAPRSAAVLTEYEDAVAALVAEVLGSLQPEDLGRVIDRSYDPPVTVGVRLVSLISDALQHLGQAGYVRGLLQRQS